LAALAACGGGGPGAIAVPVPASSAEIAAICAQVAPALPATIDGLKRRDATPRSDRTAAWGDPAVIVRCGVERPAALRSTSQLDTVNGVDWLIEERGGGHVFTSVNRAIYVEVTVPAGHDPQVGPLVDVAPAMQRVPVREEPYPAERTKTDKTAKPKPKP
jgi:hypothetical protein